MADRIPKLPDEEFQRRQERIRPLVRDQDWLYYIEPVDSWKVAFEWDPKRKDHAEELREVARIQTFHTFGYYGFFKPTVGEVLSQIPEEWAMVVTAFEVNGPQTATDLNRNRDLLNEGYHVAETILYSTNPKPKRRSRFALAKKGV